MEHMKRKLVLQNGDAYIGKGFGANCEAVFHLTHVNASVGYQEILTDPQNTHQIVLFTYPLVGNYGMTDEDNEKKNVTVGGVVVRDYCDTPSNFRFTKTLSEALEENNVPGIYDVDTRRIMHTLTLMGSQKAMICDVEKSTEDALKEIQDYEERKDLISLVSCKKKWYSRTPNPMYNVVLLDLGVKNSLIKQFNRLKCNITVVPYNTPAQQILDCKPDGIVISNGPVAVDNMAEVEKIVQEVQGACPLLALGTGHLIYAKSQGAKLEQLFLGHHGGNYPVQNLKTGKIIITAQGNDCVVQKESLQDTALELIEENVMDKTVCAVTGKNALSVQYNIEGAPGPSDTLNVFTQFINMMEENKHA